MRLTQLIRSRRFNPAAHLPTAFIFLATVLLATSARGQTSSMSLPAVGLGPDAKPIVTRCQSNWAKSFAYANMVATADQENRLADVDLKDYGNSFAMVSQMFRDSQRLLDLREPAGVDYEYRAKRIQRELKGIANKLKSTPNGSTYSQKAEQYKNSSAKKRQKALQRVIAIAQKGELKKAEAELDEILRDVDAYVIWLNPTSTKQIIDEVNQASSKFTVQLKEQREAEAIESYSKAINASLPNIDSLLAMAEKAITEIGSSGSATIGRKTVNGPQTLQELFVAWQNAQTNLNRCCTLFQIGGGSKLSVTPQEIIGSSLAATNWNDAASKLSQKMSEAFAKLIAADLKRLTNDEAAKGIYLRYLSTLGAMKHCVSNATIEACERELAALENRPGALATSIKNYKQATSDTLLWRKRSAASSARRAGTNSLQMAAEKFKDSSFVPSLQKGLDTYPNELLGTAQEMTVHANNIQSITASAGYSVYDENAWATIIGEFSVEQELNELRSDLFVGAGSPPLSVAAATSVLSAKRKHLMAAGGPVQSVQVESAGARFSKLPANMSSFVPLDKVHSGDSNLRSTLLRFNIKPSWVQHEHFFKKL